MNVSQLFDELDSKGFVFVAGGHTMSRLHKNFESERLEREGVYYFIRTMRGITYRKKKENAS